MPTVLNCYIREDALPALMRLRATHLAYIEAHKAEIMFGGPARGPDGLPQEMIIVLKTDDHTAAQAFSQTEPYTASGEVFAAVKIRPWSQVMPEQHPGALAAAIAKEEAEERPGSPP